MMFLRVRTLSGLLSQDQHARTLVLWQGFIADVPAAPRVGTCHFQNSLSGLMRSDSGGRHRSASFPRRRESRPRAATRAMDSRFRGNDGQQNAYALAHSATALCRSSTVLYFGVGV